MAMEVETNMEATKALLMKIKKTRKMQRLKPRKQLPQLPKQRR